MEARAWSLMLVSCSACAGPGGVSSISGIEGPSYVLTVEAPERGRVGEGLRTLFVLTPRAPYHVTQDYPIELLVQGGTAAVPKELTLGPADMEVFTRDELRARMLFRFEQPGRHTLEAVLRFSLCTAERCEELTASRQWSTIVD